MSDLLHEPLLAVCKFIQSNVHMVKPGLNHPSETVDCPGNSLVQRPIAILFRDIFCIF